MKALERPAYIQSAQAKAQELGEQSRVRKQIKNNPELKKFWNLGHSDLTIKNFPNRECEVAFYLGRQNHEASDMDD